MLLKGIRFPFFLELLTPDFAPGCQASLSFSQCLRPAIVRRDPLATTQASASPGESPDTADP